MGFDNLKQAPHRMFITNVSTGDLIDAQFNPTDFQEQLEINWARQTVPGLSHQPLQFVNTNNTKFTMDLIFEALDSGSSLAQIASNRRFLQSLCYPRRGAATVVSGGPPRVLFIWPKVIALNCIITSLCFTYHRFNLDGTPARYCASVALEEIRDVRLLSEDVFNSGTQLRSGGGRDFI